MAHNYPLAGELAGWVVGGCERSLTGRGHTGGKEGRRGARCVCVCVCVCVIHEHMCSCVYISYILQLSFPVFRPVCAPVLRGASSTTPNPLHRGQLDALWQTREQFDFAQHWAAPRHNEVIMTLPLVHFGPGPAVFFPSIQSLHSLIYLASISSRNL